VALSCSYNKYFLSLFLVAPFAFSRSREESWTKAQNAKSLVNRFLYPISLSLSPSLVFLPRAYAQTSAGNRISAIKAG
jgi:hypothetical protein